MKKLATSCAMALMLCWAMSSPAQASLTVGVPFVVGNCLPFACAKAYNVDRYQQIYSASAFSGMQTINTLSFNLLEAGDMGSTTYTISLSTTAKALNDLDTGNPSSNVGGNNTWFGTFSRSGPAPGVLTFVGADFTYNPALGNLLMDISISNATLTDSPAYFEIDVTGTSTQRLLARPDGVGTDQAGLVTTFGYTERNDVPEPATTAMLALGLLGMVASRRKKLV